MNEAAVTFSWLPAVLFLVGGMLVGLILAWWTQRKGAGSEAGELPPVEVRDLEEKEAALLAQLEELEDTADKYTPERLAEHRRRIEVAAAETLRQLDERRAEDERRREEEGKPSPAPTPRSQGVLARNPALKGFVWGAGAVTALALLVFSVSRSTAPRAPGGSLTGNAPSEVASAAPQGDDDAALEARIRANPDDFEARIEKAHLDLAKGDLQSVWNETQYVLQRQPGNPEALSFQALVRFAGGDPETAIDMLHQALEKAPDLPDAYAILALVQAHSGHLDQARQTIDQAEARLPEQRTMFEQMYAQLKAQSMNAAGGAGPNEAGTAAPSEAPQAPPASAGTARVSGVVALGLGAEPPPGGVLFVLVRPAGVTSGPPTAVKRFASPSFPLHFALSDADSMMGQPFPERFRIEALLDGDGNPMTHSAGDLSAELDNQSLGATDLRLNLEP